PSEACRLAEAGRRWLGSIERGPVPQEEVVDQLVRVDWQPRLLNRSVVGGAQPSHQTRVLLRLFAGRDGRDGNDSGIRQTEGQEVAGAEGPKPSFRAGPTESVTLVRFGVDWHAAGQREVVHPPERSQVKGGGD